MSSGKIIKKSKFANISRIFQLSNFKDRLLFTYNNKPYVLDMWDKLSFKEWSFLKVSYIYFGMTTSEKEYLNYFKYCYREYQNSYFL